MRTDKQLPECNYIRVWSVQPVQLGLRVFVLNPNQQSLLLALEHLVAVSDRERASLSMLGGVRQRCSDIRRCGCLRALGVKLGNACGGDGHDELDEGGREAWRAREGLL